MRVVLQRVSQASVQVAGQQIAQIKQGFLLLVGFEEGDGQEQLERIAHKISNVRVFSDTAGKMNLSIKQVQGEILSVSQFTLYAALRKGNRPSFTLAQNPTIAAQNYQTFNQLLRASGTPVAEGIFGAEMKVSLVNDGPVTLVYDTDQLV
ncbi:D-aminoacyl-tRNA deacylase [Liquorilactobacillus satsumensis]|uniref:D-aminoacyl-tRNA deacylase n=1 Tax=Liquorilactobacillus satsumensis DSM 16230 = JCM 12392 TaxID=1423801 RepID=A0A0R1V1P4_9LACO|nr:D-aminoacyl-tRNA deacylase [Liquorilactobacillus satsumensis]KRL99438.1 D-tyrosyl-tRNA(Tyr) deacylase [Liquorilactobacillus satsumensis DSM 16230 = JCM 12392]